MLSRNNSTGLVYGSSTSPRPSGITPALAGPLSTHSFALGSTQSTPFMSLSDVWSTVLDVVGRTNRRPILPPSPAHGTVQFDRYAQLPPHRAFATVIGVRRCFGPGRVVDATGLRRKNSFVLRSPSFAIPPVALGHPSPSPLPCVTLRT